MITGGNSLDLASYDDSLKPNVVVLCRDIEPYPPAKYLAGIALKSCADTRNNQLIDIKSCNYLFNFLCLQDARSEHYEDALFYNAQGQITEGTTFNFIWFEDDGVVCSSPFEKNCLPGTTLTLLIEGLKEENIPFQWRALSQKNLTKIAGCAVMSSTRFVVPVNRIDMIEFDIKKNLPLFEKLNKILIKRLGI